MTPTVGRIVMLVGPAAEANGATVAPAVITRVWNTGKNGQPPCINVTVFPDAMPTKTATSVYLHEDEDTARDSLSPGGGNAAFWPSRV